MDTSSLLTCHRQGITPPAWDSAICSGTSPRGTWTLAVVPHQAIRLHEEYDPSRAAPLMQAMARDGVQRHPVIVAREPGGGLLHLDGANRLTALARLECPHVVVQVVDYADPQVELNSWIHLTSLPLTTLHQDGASWPTLQMELVPAAEVPAVLRQERCVAVLVTADGGTWRVSSGMGLLDRVTTMRHLVAAYALPPVREALPVGAPVAAAQGLLAQAPQATIAVLFAPLRKTEVVTLALDLDMPLPAGVTRHLLHGGRLLQVNAPLDLLQSALPVAEKAAQLRATLAQQQCRVYAEPTIVYEFR